jgi:hypothetical protein
MAPFTLTLKPSEDPQHGGCADPSGCQEEMPPLPGVILFPTDLSLLHQFFSVVLLATNGAPEGDVLTIRDLTAKIRLPSGLAQARTEPPTTLGTPVPMRVPGPDGELGTADDLTFLVAQATAEAEFLVEGCAKAPHRRLRSRGRPRGPADRIRRLARHGARRRRRSRPTLGIVVSHPDVVRADEEYTMELGRTTASRPQPGLARPAAERLAGVVVVGDEPPDGMLICQGESDSSSSACARRSPAE